MGCSPSGVTRGEAPLQLPPCMLLSSGGFSLYDGSLKSSYCLASLVAPKLLYILASVLNTLFPAEHIFSGQTEKEESRSQPGAVHEGDSCRGTLGARGRAQGREGCRSMCVAGSKVGGDRKGRCVREKVEICVLVEKGETRETVSVYVCVPMHKWLGFSSLLPPQASPKN